MGQSDDRELVEALRRGERRAFDRVYDAYRSRIYGFLLRLAGRREIADDLFQETWMSLARSAPRLRDDTDLAAWLFTVARNAYRSHRRWSLLDVSRLVLLGDDEPPAATVDGSDERARDDVAALEEALLAIPPAHREVLLLVAIEGFDQERVGEMLGISYAAVRQRLSRARAQLAEEMDRREKRSRVVSLPLRKAGGS